MAAEEIQVQRHLVVTGSVQGVGFRESCRQAACGLGVRGWVRNRADGSVEAVLEGPASAVEAMVGWCRHGPPWATVSHVEVSSRPPEGLSGFDVR